MAFDLLRRFLDEELAKGGRKVVFLDELPNLILVICGSAASWMIVNVLHHKGRLHNRVTRSLALQPFHLQETEELLRGRGISLDRDQILELFMAVGGIPYYLDYVRRGRSAAQNIDSMFFAHNAPLRDEFSQLYAALFDHHERHVKVIEALATRHSGMTRDDLRAATRLSTEGRLMNILSELESTGFILRVTPFGKTARDSIYRLIDAFSLFHLHWVVSAHASQDGGLVAASAIGARRHGVEWLRV